MDAGLLILAGPGSCALSCYTAPRAVADAVEACHGGDVDDCLDRFSDEDLAKDLAEGIPLLAERCGAQLEFETRGIEVDIDGPLHMTAKIRGRLVAGDCPFPESVVHLEGNAMRWRVAEFVRP